MFKLIGSFISGEEDEEGYLLLVMTRIWSAYYYV